MHMVNTGWLLCVAALDAGHGGAGDVMARQAHVDAARARRGGETAATAGALHPRPTHARPAGADQI